MKGTLVIRKFGIRERSAGRFPSSQNIQSPNFPIPPSRQAGFTLLELVIALLLIALLVGMVFSTARSSLVLGNSVVQTQNEEMLHQAFFELLENRLAALPGNTRMDLKVTDAGSHYLTDLTLEQVPLSFTWGGQDRTAKAIQISTVKRRSGFLDIVLRYYENEIIDPESSSTALADEQKPFAEIVLLTDLAYFEWRALDGRTMEFQYDWELPGRLPLQMELSCKFGASGEEIRQIFWIPPRQNPEVFMRQLQQSAGQPGGGNPGNPDGDTEVEIPDIETIPGDNNNLPPGVTPPGE